MPELLALICNAKPKFTLAAMRSNLDCWFEKTQIVNSMTKARKGDADFILKFSEDFAKNQTALDEGMEKF